jgi:hypothetical protein
MRGDLYRLRGPALAVGLGLASLVFSMPLATAADRPGHQPLMVAQIAEERIPAKDLPSSILPESGPSAEPSSIAPQPSSIASPSGDWRRAPNATLRKGLGDADTEVNEPRIPEPMAPNDTASPNVAATPGTASVESPQNTDATGAQAPGAAATAPPPALDLSTAAAAPDLGTASLDPEIRRASSPALMASIRLTEQARIELGQGTTDSALRDLGRAVSVDPGNPFAYYYLGRVYLTRKNYAQALTFFQRAELGFAGRSDWLGETRSFEGACDEELGRAPDAAKAYQGAVAAAPGNFRAQAGYGRHGPATVQPVAADVSSSDSIITGPPPDAVPAPPPAAAPPPPPDEPPPLPPTDSRD